jgi:phosphoribosyl 1,2-cyclic phosphodiesterase
MLVRFWGTRGSLPAPASAETIRDKVVEALLAASGRRFADRSEAAAFADGLDFAVAGGYGGNTSCVELEGGDGSFIVCDMGSGLREFGLDAARRVAAGHRKDYNFFMSHLHWDHIMGFPFFGVAFDPESTIRIHGGHAEMEQALRRQQEKISFPVPFDWLRARFEFVTLEPGRTYEIAGLSVEMVKQYHSNDSYGFRFSDGRSVVVYSTDSEHRVDDMESEAVFERFFREADLVISDTMYSLADAVTAKQDWGHSSNLVAVDLCHSAQARRLAMFHHEPTSSDADLQRLHADTVRYEELNRGNAPALEVLCAYDGLEVTV